jgi:hypothetical protein
MVGDQLVHFLYPADPVEPKRPEEPFLDQIQELHKSGFSTSLVWLEELWEEDVRIRGAIPAGATVVYRGWMLGPPEYEKLLSLIRPLQANPLTSLESYLACHYLPNWYPRVAEFTADTKIFPVGSDGVADVVAELKTLNWKKFFLKDYVKSLKTSVGPVISTPEEVGAVVAELQKYRGLIEGGVCVRRFEEFVPGSGKRYFVLHNRPHAASGEVPALVSECVRRIQSPFFSIDVALRTDGVLRVVEIRDGQVSDPVGWEASRFAEIWTSSDPT